MDVYIQNKEQILDAIKENIPFLLHSTLTNLDLYGKNISHTGASRIATSLQYNSTLTNLDLSYNNIGHTGASQIANSLQHNSTLTSLYLGNNNIGHTGASQIAISLQHNSTLTNLSLYDNNIGDTGASKIANSLQHNSTLTNLYLQRNKIGVTGATQIANILKHNSTLTNLDLSYNNIGGELLTIIGQLLQRNKEKAAAEKAAAEKAAAEKAAVERAAAEKAAAERAAAEKAAAEEAAAERASADKVAAERAAAEKAAAERAAAEKAAAERASADKAAERASADKAAAERAAAEKESAKRTELSQNPQDKLKSTYPVPVAESVSSTVELSKSPIVPTLSISKWDKHQVYQRLKQDTIFSSCAETFMKEDIDGSALIKLEDKDLQELRINLGLRKKFPSFIKELGSVGKNFTLEKTNQPLTLQQKNSLEPPTARISPGKGFLEIIPSEPSDPNSVINCLENYAMKKNLSTGVIQQFQDKIHDFSKFDPPERAFALALCWLYTTESWVSPQMNKMLMDDSLTELAPYMKALIQSYVHFKYFHTGVVYCRTELTEKGLAFYKTEPQFVWSTFTFTAIDFDHFGSSLFVIRIPQKFNDYALCLENVSVSTERVVLLLPNIGYTVQSVEAGPTEEYPNTSHIINVVMSYVWPI